MRLNIVDLVFCTITAAAYTSKETDLVDYLLEKYDPRVKPTLHHKTAVNVTFRPELYLIIDTNEPQQSITVHLWISEVWKDQLLHWNPDKFDGIKRVTLTYDSVWRPDTVLYNSIMMHEEKIRNVHNIQLDLNYSEKHSLVTFRYPAIFTFSCKFSAQRFPFDSQNCTMVFGSWTFDQSAIDYFLGFDLSSGTTNFIESTAWELVRFEGRKHLTKYTCCPEVWPSLSYSLILRRKPLFFIINLIIPTIIVSFVSVLGLFSPSISTGERTEKVTLGITTLLAMAILLMTVADQMPTTSTYVPIIAWFYLLKIVLISCATITTILIIRVHQNGRYGKRAPKRWRDIAMKYSKYLRVPIPPPITVTKNRKKKIDKKSTQLIELQNELRGLAKSASQYEVVLSEMEPILDYKKQELLNDFEGNSESSFSDMAPIDVGLVTPEEFKQFVRDEWDWLALVLNRTALVLCIILWFITCMVIIIPYWAS